jgi:hypothetical protein
MANQQQQVQTPAGDPEVRAAVVAALTAMGATVESDQPGALEIHTGSVGKAFLAGPFRAADKMPMRIRLTTTPAAGGTAVTVDVGAHGTGSGFASGGLIGMSKQKKATAAWLQKVVEIIPMQAGGAAPPGSPAPPTPPGEFTS